MEAQAQNTLIWEVTVWEFLFVTVILGGGAAYLTGRAMALTWGGPARLALYIVLLGFAVRFIHFSLYHGTLISPYYYVVDVIVLLGFAFLGRRVTRAKQMVRQYGFKYRPAGRFGWTRTG